MKTVCSSPPLVRPADEDLATLARRANSRHEACRRNNREALYRAHEAGMALVEAKARVLAERGHEWLAWLAENVAFDRVRAAEYIRIADNWEWIEQECTRDVHMGYREALSLLITPRDTIELEAWERPDGRPTVAQAETQIDELLAELPPERQLELLDRAESRVLEQQSRDEKGEQGDGRAQRLKRAGDKVAQARRQLLGLGHEADVPLATLDRASREIAELET